EADRTEPDHIDVPESDAETRMLQQIAALDNGSQWRDATQPDSGEDAAAAEAATASADHDRDSADDHEHETEQTQMISPLAAGGGGGTVRDHGGDGTADEPPKKRRWRWILAAVVVCLGIGYVGVAYATQDSLPSTLTVEGVDVSGLSVEEAAPAIDEELASRADRELLVTAA